MNVKILYHSRSGNTEKVAQSMAQALGIKAESLVSSYPFETMDLIFLGDGIYAGKPDPKMVAYIKTLDSKKVKHAVVFGTIGSQTKGITVMQNLLRERGIHVFDEYFTCKGKAFIFLNRNHPNEDDLQEAKKFAKNIMGKI